MAKFIVVEQYVGIPGEGYNFSFIDVEFHAVSNAPTLYESLCQTEVDCSPEGI
jgi:hypothetical protein